MSKKELMKFSKEKLANILYYTEKHYHNRGYGIEIGDYVMLLDKGQVYDSYIDWEGLGEKRDMFINQKNKVPEPYKLYKVIKKGKHECCQCYIALIQDEKNNIFMVCTEGLEKYEE